MKKSLFLLALPLLLVTSAFADDQLRSVQGELKSQGFFYGEVSGQPSPETVSALRRFQIRNGLEVTGTANKETLASLGLGPAKSAGPGAPPPSPQPPPPIGAKKPTVNLLKDGTQEESDRAFLEREEARRRAADPDSRYGQGSSTPPVQRDPSIVSPPAPLDGSGDDFPVLFAQTPYATAPREVQQRTLRNAQAVLASRGFYRDIIDGLPGPATEEALLTYQRSSRMTLTGRLDIQTLSALRLLPGRGGFTRGSEPPPSSTQRVYRGIWVN